jgi:hypothetical protein
MKISWSLVSSLSFFLLPLFADVRAAETDRCLVEDPRFREFVELYAQDQSRFFKDYAEAQRKLSELGSHFLPSPSERDCVVLEF